MVTCLGCSPTASWNMSFFMDINQLMFPEFRKELILRAKNFSQADAIMTSQYIVPIDW